MAVRGKEERLQASRRPYAHLLPIGPTRSQIVAAVFSQGGHCAQFVIIRGAFSNRLKIRFTDCGYLIGMSLFLQLLAIGVCVALIGASVGFAFTMAGIGASRQTGLLDEADDHEAQDLAGNLSVDLH